MACSRGHLLFHPQRLLYILGQLYFPYRCHRIHPSWSYPTGRFCPHMVRDVHNQVGRITRQLQSVAVDSYRIHSRHVHLHHHHDRNFVCLLCWLGLWIKPLLHLSQSCIEHHRDNNVCASLYSRIQSPLRSSPIRNGCCLLHISYCFRSGQSCCRYDSM